MNDAASTSQNMNSITAITRLPAGGDGLNKYPIVNATKMMNSTHLALFFRRETANQKNGS
jgi:hypothetical protein